MKNLNININYLIIICGLFAAAEFSLKFCAQGMSALNISVFSTDIWGEKKHKNKFWGKSRLLQQRNQLPSTKL